MRVQYDREFNLIITIIYTMWMCIILKQISKGRSILQIQNMLLD